MTHLEVFEDRFEATPQLNLDIAAMTQVEALRLIRSNEKVSPAQADDIRAVGRLGRRLSR